MDSTNTPQAMPAQDVLDREYLEIRAKLLEVAASLDRMDRGEGSVSNDYRIQQFRNALQLIMDGNRDRAEQLQMIFSRPYDENWRQDFQLSNA